MEQKNKAGIYLKKDQVIIVAGTGKDLKNPKVFCSDLKSEDKKDDESSGPSIGSMAAEKIKSVGQTRVNMAVDCGYYTQHKIHTKFTDPRQISQTIKFDAEEVLAADVFEKAIAFEVNSKDSNGSDVTIYSADKKDLADILSDFQSNKAEPVIMEPDVECLVKFIEAKLRNNLSLKGSVLVFLSNERCYTISFTEGASRPFTRSFLTSQQEDKTGLLQRQITLTSAGFSCGMENLKFYLADTTDTADIPKLGERLGIEIEKINIADYLPKIEAGTQILDAAVAYGSYLSEDGGVDFRKDFSPYRGQREAIEKTLKIMSVFVSIIFLSLGVFFQLEAFEKGENVKKAKEKLYNEAGMIISRKRLGGDSKESVVSILKREIIRLNQQKSGQLTLEEGSIEAKLNYILEAINTVPGNVDLNIETIDVSQNSMRVIGDTDSSRSTLIFYDAIKKHSNLIIDERSSKESGDRNKFRVSMRAGN